MIGVLTALALEYAGAGWVAAYVAMLHIIVASAFVVAVLGVALP
jgi:hypothetical protein